MKRWIIGGQGPEAVCTYLAGMYEQRQGRLVVCFDYFDTLVTRTIDPEFTKVIASTVLSEALGISLGGDDIYALRRDLEARLTSENAERYGELDFRLDHFAEQFLPELEKRFIVPGRLTLNDFSSLLLGIEGAVERAVQRLCPEMAKVLAFLAEQNIPRVLVSDFYLPGREFRRMVAHQGVASMFSRIYVSADYRKSKGSGSLYREMARDLNRDPEELIMIGDNPHADIEMALRSGLNTLQVERPAQIRYYEEIRRGREDRRVPSSHAFSDLKLPDVVFPEMGISLWLFTHRLFTALREAGVADVFFFSKEGEFLQRLFVVYQETLFGGTVIRPHYLLVSRKATFIASLGPLEDEDFHRLFNNYRDISIKEFLQSLNMPGETVARIIDELRVDAEIRLDNTAEHAHFKRLCSLPIFHETYESLRLEQAANLREYLNSFGIDFQRKGMCLVDVGWKGSIQDNLFHVLGGEVSLRGFYLGSLHASELSERNVKRGLLFDTAAQDSGFLCVYNNNRSLFEMLLGASHGSADQYRRDVELQAGMLPQLRIHETRRTETGAGVHVLVRDIPEEQSLYQQVIRPVQEQLFALFCTMTRRFLEHRCQLPDQRWFAEAHARMVYLPTAAEIDFFEELYHLENFGIFEFTRFETGHRFSRIERLKHLKNIVTDPGILESGIWPPIILRRFGVGFWQPVDGRRRWYRCFGNLRLIR